MREFNNFEGSDEDIARYWYYEGVEGLFNEGEEYIVKDTYWSFLYVVYILKGRFRAFEEEGERDLYWWRYVEYLKKKKGIEV